jgi:hypothetical protein
VVDQKKNGDTTNKNHFRGSIVLGALNFVPLIFSTCNPKYSFRWLKYEPEGSRKTPMKPTQLIRPG